MVSPHQRLILRPFWPFFLEILSSLSVHPYSICSIPGLHSRETLCTVEGLWSPKNQNDKPSLWCICPVIIGLQSPNINCSSICILSAKVLWSIAHFSESKYMLWRLLSLFFRCCQFLEISQLTYSNQKAWTNTKPLELLFWYWMKLYSIVLRGWHQSATGCYIIWMGGWHMCWNNFWMCQVTIKSTTILSIWHLLGCTC